MHVAVALEVDPVGPNLPASQRVPAQVDAPAVGEYLPAPQSRHDDAAVAVEYLPAPQSRHDDDDAAEYLPAKQSVHAADPYHKDDHVPVKPLRVREPSDVNVTLRNPVDEVYTLDEPRDPECLRIRCDDDSQLHR